MRQILSKSGSLVQQLHSNKLGLKGLVYSFSAMPPNMGIQKAVEFQFKFRSILKLSELNEYLLENKEDVKKYGKTILLQFLNEYPMQSFRRSRDEFDMAKREQKYRMRNKIYMFLIELEDLNFYELNMRYAILKKLITYVGQDPIIIEEVNRTQQMLIKLLKAGDLHVSDIMNWLYMLPLNYKLEHSCLAFDLLQLKFQHPEVRDYFKNQRSLPALIKRIYQLDWSKLRKYKNIIKFFCYEASVRDVDSLQQIVTQLERLVMMKLHLVGEKVIPKMIDEIMEKFDNEFEMLTKNKQTLLRVFSIFKHLPLNYNIKFFNKIHNFMRGTKQLPSHLLIYLPYNKLTQSQIAYLQSKMFAVGREDIASKLIYTIYTPDYKDALTPFIIKEAYSNLLEMWKKDGGRVVADYQIYLSIIFRFIKINNPIIDHSKLRHIFSKIAHKVQQQNFDVFNTFSFPAIIAFLELCGHYQTHLNEKTLTFKIENVLKSRKQKNSLTLYTDFLISALKVHHNASHKKSKYFLTQFVNQIVNNPEVDFNQRIELLFLIEKTMNPDQKWQQFSKTLSKELTQDIDSFIEVYIKYDQKTLKLTNFVFNVLYEKKVNFSTVMELLSSLSLKLITSLKGKLIPSLKKYINEMDLTKFNISQTSMSVLVHSLRLLFYFKNQIAEFMEYFSIKIIQKIQLKLKEGEHINGKQFALLSNYIMEVVKNIQIKKKTSVIQSIVSIIKTLRKKEGIYLKVYELDFLCNNQKYIKINQDVLDLHWNDIITTLKKTDRIEHHKELMFIIIKLHCRQFVELTPSDLRYFTQNSTQMIQRSALNLSEIKECLGYDILDCENDFVIQKMKIHLSSLVKLAFRKDKRKKSYFMYEYYLKFFSKLSMKQMIIEICEKLLYEKLYPVEVSNIIPILNKNQIKNKKFIKRILQIMSLAESFVTFEKMQTVSWLEKISYDMPQTDFNFNKIKNKVQEEILEKISALKLFLKNQLGQQDRSIESGFEVQDPNFDKNYKVFIQYAWASLKYKNINTPQMKFICRYLFFSLQKIKGRIQNPEERKQISKIKLYHVLKYIKEMGFFYFDEEIAENAFREKNIMMEKIRKNKILSKMEKDLSIMKIQKCGKLQNKLVEFNGLINFKVKYQFVDAGKKERPTVEYYLQEKADKNKTMIKNKFIIHTVKKYHITVQSDSLPQVQHAQENGKDSDSETKKQQADLNPFFKTGEIDILEMGLNEQNQDIQLDEKHIQRTQDIIKESYIEEPYISLELKPEKEVITSKDTKQEKTPKKPLFSLQKSKKAQEKALTSNYPLKFDTVLKVEKATQELCRDYNGYLKVEKSLIELSTGLKCIIYDPEKDIFFD